MVAFLSAGDQRWQIRYDCVMPDVPPDTHAQLIVMLRLVADELATIDARSMVWSRLREGELHLEALGWRFAYSVPRRGLLAVRGAHPIPKPA